MSEQVIIDGEMNLDSAFDGLPNEQIVVNVTGAPKIIDKASGKIVSIVDGAENTPLKSAIVNIEPVQDLHGYDSPWPAGGGVNKFNSEATTLNGFTRSGDTFTNSQTDTRSEPQILVQAFNGDTYLGQSGTFVSKGNNRYGNYYAVPANVTRLRIKHNGQTKDLTIDFNWTTVGTIYVSLEIVSWNPTTVGGLVIRNIMIALTETYSPFSPYSNICPISGWTQMKVVAAGYNVWDEEWELGSFDASTGAETTAQTTIRSKNYITVKPGSGYYYHTGGTDVYLTVVFYDGNKNIIQVKSGASGSIHNGSTITPPSGAYYMRFAPQGAGGTYGNNISINYPSTDHAYHAYQGTPINIPLGQTVYGGTLDVLRGKLNVKPYYASYSGQTLVGPWISSHDKYVAGETPTTGAQVVDMGAAGTDYDVTPQTIKTLLGVNNIWADAGSMEIEYVADTKLYIQRLTAPTEDDMIANENIASGKFFMVGNDLLISTAAIVAGETIVPGTNCTKLSLAEALNNINA